FSVADVSEIVAARSLAPDLGASPLQLGACSDTGGASTAAFVSAAESAGLGSEIKDLTGSALAEPAARVLNGSCLAKSCPAASLTGAEDCAAFASGMPEGIAPAASFVGSVLAMFSP